MRILRDHPYLCWSIMLFVIFLVTYLTAKQFRPLMVFSGIASAVYSLTAVFFVPEYWEPVLVLKSLVGLEDLLFSFANGGIVCFLSLWPVRKRISIKFTFSGLLNRYLGWTFIGAIICYVFRKTGATIMGCCMMAMIIIGVTMLFKNKRFWLLSLTGAIGYTALYIGVMTVLGQWFPSFHTQWNFENLWGYRFLSFPLEEFVWAFGFGAVFPLIMAFAFGITLNDSGNSGNNSQYRILPVR